jgi:hypothetical protein
MAWEVIYDFRPQGYVLFAAPPLRVKPLHILKGQSSEILIPFFDIYG